MTRPPFPLVALVILDGWGLAPPGPGNAVELAETPVFDKLWRRYPHATLGASGPAVGLPAGQMGNSEVGHLTIGSGRIIDQDLVRIDRSIERGDFFENPSLVAAFARARERRGTVHLLGLVSAGGVHSHLDHLRALLELSRRQGMVGQTVVHAFTDGRDVSPTAAAGDLAALVAEGATIATVTGRYYAMDRDQRWERTDRAFTAIVRGEGLYAGDPVTTIKECYDRGITDEFIEPTVIGGYGQQGVAAGDALLAFNFRPDRARQLTRRLLDERFDLTTMTRYGDGFDCPAAFPEHNVTETISQVVAEHGFEQLHVAETEKYAHVTYFLNGGTERAWDGEMRILVPSPRDVATYDEKPEMSASEVTSRFAGAIATGRHRFAIVNFANADMVGHTGVIEAVVRAVETVDTCLREVVHAVEAQGGVCLVCADHGNAEQLLEADGASPHTAHTTNPVPLILTAEGLRLRADGGLADLAPTCLELLGIARPSEMSGTSLLA